MGIAKRVVRLIKSDINGILDCLEEPRAILEQAIRDMETEVQASEAARNYADDEIKRFEKTVCQVRRMQQEAVNQIDLAFESGNDRLARNFIRRRLECEKRIEQINALSEKTAANREKLEAKLKEQLEKLQAVKEKRELFSESEAQTSAPDILADSFYVTDEQVEVAMLEERRKRSGGERK